MEATASRSNRHLPSARVGRNRLVAGTALVAATAALVLGACGSDGAETAPTTTVSTVVPALAVDPITHLAVQGLAGDTVSAWEDDGMDGCSTRTIDVVRGHTRFEVASFSSDCDFNQPMNGRHGTYGGLSDPAVPADATAMSLPIGSAKAFTQRYLEYTQSENEYHESVVLIELSDPSDAAFTMVMVVSEAYEDPAAVLDLARSLTIAP